MYIRILENDDWIVEYDIENNQYRVSYFQDYHFVDQILFNEVDRSKSMKNKKCGDDSQTNPMKAVKTTSLPTKHEFSSGKMDI